MNKMAVQLGLLVLLIVSVATGMEDDVCSHPVTRLIKYQGKKC